MSLENTLREMLNEMKKMPEKGEPDPTVHSGPKDSEKYKRSLEAHKPKPKTLPKPHSPLKEHYKQRLEDEMLEEGLLGRIGKKLKRAGETVSALIRNPLQSTDPRYTDGGSNDGASQIVRDAARGSGVARDLLAQGARRSKLLSGKSFGGPAGSRMRVTVPGNLYGERPLTPSRRKEELQDQRRRAATSRSYGISPRIGRIDREGFKVDLPTPGPSGQTTVQLSAPQPGGKARPAWRRRFGY